MSSPVIDFNDDALMLSSFENNSTEVVDSQSSVENSHTTEDEMDSTLVDLSVMEATSSPER